MDCDNGQITYITRHGERTEAIVCSRDMLLYPAIDSDENGHYKVRALTVRGRTLDDILDWVASGGREALPFIYWPAN